MTTSEDLPGATDAAGSPPPATPDESDRADIPAGNAGARGFGPDPDGQRDPMPAELQEGAEREERHIRHADPAEATEGPAPTG